LRIVDRVDRKITAFDAGAVAGVAHFVFGVGVPCAVNGIDLKADLVHRDLIADVVEDEKLGFGSAIERVADARRFKVGFGLEGGASGVAVVGFHRVGFDDVAMQAKGLFGVKGVDIGAVGVGHQFHV
jgi:hypothetical protein